MLSISSLPNFPVSRSSLSSDLQRWNVLELLPKLQFRLMQVVALLQTEPEIGTVAAQLTKPQRHAGGDRLLFLPHIVKRLTRNAEQLGDLRLGPIERRQNLLAKEFSGMHRRQAALWELSGHGPILSGGLPSTRY